MTESLIFVVRSAEDGFRIFYKTNRFIDREEGKQTFMATQYSLVFLARAVENMAKNNLWK